VTTIEGTILWGGRAYPTDSVGPGSVARRCSSEAIGRAASPVRATLIRTPVLLTSVLL
jgi:hypothetical protein